MKRKIKISTESPYRTYMPKDIVDEGIKGDTIVMCNAVTATIVKPGTPIRDIVRSMELIIDDLRLRLLRGEELFDETR